MMKKKIVAMACVAAMSASAVPAFGAEGLKVLVNDTAVTFTGQQPVIQDGSTLIPVRGALQAMGVAVVWDEGTNSVKLSKEDKNAALVIGEKTFMAGGEKKELSAPAQMIGGSTMIPLRAVAEYFGGTVTWEEATQTVLVVMAAKEEMKPEAKPEETPVVKNEMFETAVYEAQLKADDGTLLMEVKAQYPKFTEKAAGAKTAELNKKIETEMKAQADKIIADNKVALEKEAKTLGKDFQNSQYVVNFETPFADGKTVSYLSSAYLYTGGAHGNTVATAYTYDVATMKMKTVGDYITLENGVKAETILTNAVLDDIKANPDGYFEDAAKLLGESKTPLGFYLNEKGEFVVFISEPMVVAPYAAGLVKVVKNLG